MKQATILVGCHAATNRLFPMFTLQDIFYEKADALVGVARDGDLACSKTYTFDLSRFEAPSHEDAAQLLTMPFRAAKSSSVMANLEEFYFR